MEASPGCRVRLDVPTLNSFSCRAATMQVRSEITATDDQTGGRGGEMRLAALAHLEPTHA